MSGIIDFTPPYIPVLIVGVSLIVIFVIIDFISYRLLKRSQKTLKTWLAVAVTIIQSLIIAGGAVLVGPVINESLNREAVQSALTEAEVSLNDEQFKQLQEGEVVTVDGTYIVLTPVDDEGLKFELNAIPIETEDNLSLEEILTPEQ